MQDVRNAIYLDGSAILCRNLKRLGIDRDVDRQARPQCPKREEIPAPHSVRTPTTTIRGASDGAPDAPTCHLRAFGGEWTHRGRCLF